MSFKIDRREVLMGTGSLIASSVVPVRVSAGPNIPAAPVARVDIVKDTYFGETLSDPYRWMENDKDAGWLPYLKGQNEHTRAVLNTIPGRGALLKRIEQLSGDAAATRKVTRAGGRLFFEQRPESADNYKLFVQEGGVNRVLIDPTKMSESGRTSGGAAKPAGHFSLDWWDPSPDGSHIVYGISRDGSEDSVLHVLQVGDGANLPERILNTENANPQWLDDGRGFFYNQLTGRSVISTARHGFTGWEPTRRTIPS